MPVREVASDAVGLDAALAGAGVVLARDGEPLDQGKGAAVLDGPVQALWHFVQAQRACPGAPPLQAGDIVTNRHLDRRLARGPGPDLARRIRRAALATDAAAGVSSPIGGRHGENPMRESSPPR